MAFERVDSTEIWSGKIASVRVDRVRYDDGEEADREIVGHPGAVAIVAHDGEQIYLVTGLYDEAAEAEENERIEIKQVPLSDLDDLIRDCRDSKTLIGLLWLKS